MALSKTNSQGWGAIPTKWMTANDILTSTLAAFCVQQPPKKGKGSKLERVI